jgi:hypothetical protein
VTYEQYFFHVMGLACQKAPISVIKEAPREEDGALQHLASVRRQPRAVPWLKQLFSVSPLWRSGFCPRSGHVGLVLGKVRMVVGGIQSFPTSPHITT